MEFTLNLIAGIVLFSAQVIYIRQVFRKEVRPSILTWVGWSLLAGISLMSQIIEFGWNWTLMGHSFSVFGCVVICISSVAFKSYFLNRLDWIYLAAGVLCVFLYLACRDAWLTTLFAITADFFIGLPTILKAVKHPETEKSIGWLMGVIAWSFTLSTCFNKNAIYCLLPVYSLLFNGTISVLSSGHRIARMKLHSSSQQR